MTLNLNTLQLSLSMYCTVFYNEMLAELFIIVTSDTGIILFLLVKGTSE